MCEKPQCPYKGPFTTGEVMKRSLVTFLSVGLLLIASSMKVQAESFQKILAITMTNDSAANAVIVVDAASHARIQTLSTNGKGGVSNNARGVAQLDSRLLAAVNNGSGTVAVFKRAGDHLVFEQLVVTTSSPVSVEFANDHMYVAGATSVDSFVVHGSHVGAMDGTTGLVLVGGSLPPNGSTAQVGAADSQTLLVTLKTDPIPGTIDVVQLRQGAIVGTANPVSAPPGTLAPFGFSVYPDGTALITLAHSGDDGLFRNGAFTKVVNSGGQGGNCWTTRVGKYVFIVNTGSKTISRAVGTGSNIFIDTAVAANIITGGSPTDADANAGFLGVIDHGSGPGATSHLNMFMYNQFGELSPSGNILDLGVPSADGMAIMPAQSEGD
jgi:hypothetical protein